MNEEEAVEPDWSRIDEVPALIARLYQVVDELEQIFPGRRFTPDGHLVGSLGEGLAAYAYGIELNRASTAGYDALLGDVKVEVKATQRTSIAVSADDRLPDVLLVFRLDRRGVPEVVYNGPATEAWELAGRPQKNGQRQVSLAKLRSLNATIEDGDRLPVRRRLDEIQWGGDDART